MLTTNVKNELLCSAARNYDDRIFKFCVDNFKFIPTKETFFINILSRPEKYFIKRIKYISKYINNTIQKKFLLNSITTVSYSKNLLNMFFKYYYDFQISDCTIISICQNLSNNQSDGSEYKYIFNFLKSKKRKKYF